MTFNRVDGRDYNQIRPINVKYDYLGYASASALFEMGRTKILVSVCLQDSVPRFLRGQKVGWLTAEYSMLPCATHRRTNRESSQHFRNARSVEISRLIGRCFRSVVDLSLLPDKTIIIDCDVLQADGGTRVASTTAASLVLQVAIRRWIKAGIIEQSILKEPIAAISAGFVNQELLLDLSFSEDSKADADFNFVVTKSGKLIEIQGTCEKAPLSWHDFDELKKVTLLGIDQIFKACSSDNTFGKKEKDSKDKKVPLFSLANRIDKTA